MILSDVWNNTYNNQRVLIRVGGNDIFSGVIGDVPMEIMNYHVLWIKSAEDGLIIDTLRSDNMTVRDLYLYSKDGQTFILFMKGETKPCFKGNLEDCPAELIDRLVNQFHAIDFNTIEVVLY